MSPSARAGAGGALLVAVVLCAVLAGLGVARAAREREAAQRDDAAVPRLTRDDAGRPLFDVPALGPGEAVERCVRIAYVAPDGTPARVGMALRAPGGLAPFLDVELTAGAGGGFDDCGGFRPDRQLFRGTLDALDRAHGGAEDMLAAFQAGGGHAERTFRVRLALRDDAAAQGQDTGLELRWLAVGSGEPAPAPGDPGDGDDAREAVGGAGTPEPAGGAPGGRVPAGGGDAGAAGDPAGDLDRAGVAGATSAAGAPGGEPPVRGRDGGARRDAPGARRPQDAPRPATGAAGAGDASGGGDDDGALVDRIAGVLSGAARAAAPVVERGTFPALLGLLVAAFLGLQGRLDARDPKLAAAPLRDDPPLPFTDDQE